MSTERLGGVRALGTIGFEPYRAFVQIIESPNLVAPLGAAMLAAVVGFAVVLPKSLSGIQSSQAATPGITWIAIITGIVVALVSPWLAAFVSALALAATAMVSGGTMEFRTHMSVAGYARIPLVLQGLVLALMSLQLPSVQDARKLTLSLAAVIPSSNPVLHGILASIGPFELWHFGLLTFGLAATLRTKPSRVWWFGALMCGLKILLSIAAASFQGLLGA